MALLGNAPADQKKIGVYEHELLRNQINQSHERAHDASKEIRDELKELRNFLVAIDRRTSRAGDEELSLTEYLQNILKGFGNLLESSISEMTLCGSEIGDCTEKLFSSTDSQSEVINRTTSFFEKLSFQIDVVSKNADSAVSSSCEAQKQASEGITQVETLVSELTRIHRYVAHREKKLRALGEHTEEIENIIETVGNISSRTDLLALNASIESVRAGENGRGFALVAEEVRGLAEQSAQAVKDITEHVETIQSETQQSIAVAAEEKTQIEEVIRRINSTLDLLQSVTQSTTVSSEKVSDILRSSHQQLEAMQEMVMVTENFADVTKTNRSQIEGVRWSTKALVKAGSKMEDSIGIFKTNKA